MGLTPVSSPIERRHHSVASLDRQSVCLAYKELDEVWHVIAFWSAPLHACGVRMIYPHPSYELPLARGQVASCRVSHVQATLPALTQLPPLVGPASPPVDGIDLNVDYDTEIRPHLGRCIVRWLRNGVMLD